MSEPRVPPRPTADWDGEVFDALSVLRPPGTAELTPEQQARMSKRPPSNLVGVLSWHPGLTKAFLVFTNHLFRSTLSDRVREMVTVRVAWLRRGEYEWAQHVKMARAAGVSDAEIDAICEGPDSANWGPLDAALLRSVDEIVADRYICDATWTQLAEHLDRQQLMDLVFTVGAYDMLAMACNNFGVELDRGMSGFPAGTNID
ncbi:MAG TPA: carboxymuconolactone decarboxylase family protein [Trebonia sp.]